MSVRVYTLNTNDLKYAREIRVEQNLSFYVMWEELKDSTRENITK